MYPRDYFQLDPPFPRIHQVFVAMDFDDRFNPRWEHVIQPAIEGIVRDSPEGSKRLVAHRVNLPASGDSIPVDILKGIAGSLLVFADISTVGHIGRRAIRNPNVLYEVGLAHAVRMPEEVLLFRDDTDALPFDVSHVRVHDYRPDGDTTRAMYVVQERIAAALDSLNLAQSQVIARTVASLDLTAFMVLAEALKGISHPQITTLSEAMSNTFRLDAIKRLLELGAIRSILHQMKEETFNPEMRFTDAWKYELTSFGKAVLEAAAVKIFRAFPPSVQSQALDGVLKSLGGGP